MLAVGVMVHGGPEALEVVDLPEVHAGPGQVRLRVHAAAVNPTDILARDGSRAEQQKAECGAFAVKGHVEMSGLRNVAPNGWWPKSIRAGNGQTGAS